MQAHLPGWGLLVGLFEDTGSAGLFTTEVHPEHAARAAGSPQVARRRRVSQIPLATREEGVTALAPRPAARTPLALARTGEAIGTDLQ